MRLVLLMHSLDYVAHFHAVVNVAVCTYKAQAQNCPRNVCLGEASRLLSHIPELP